jgi:ABC-2 type transport system permease protein
MGVRIGVGLIQALALVVVPWMAMFAVAIRTGQARSIAQVWFYVVLLAGGGAVLAGVALLVSSLVEGEYTAPMVSFGFALACVNAPRSLHFLNPLEFMGGRDYLGPSNMLIGPVPWAHCAANVCVAALFIVASVKAVQRRDF